MLDENEVLITQLRKVIATNGQRAAREGMIIGWWLRQFKVGAWPSPTAFICGCEVCQWQRGKKGW